jgi:hypothetical protein
MSDMAMEKCTGKTVQSIKVNGLMEFKKGKANSSTQMASSNEEISKITLSF